jgi:hypothetical protein
VIVPRGPWEPISPEQREELRRCWPDGARLTAAWRLALDVETCADLLRRLPVDRDRISSEGLAWSLEHRLVRLERPIDLLLEAT